MILINHRVNSIEQLSKHNPFYGCEIDIRSDVSKPGSLHVSHDPWVRGDNFDDWLALFAQKNVQGPLILNTKEDGLEEKLIEKMENHRLTNYFFLDTALPTLVRLSTGKVFRKFAVRLSSYEPEQFTLRFAGIVDWVWVDCFFRKPKILSKTFASEMKAKLCLVSPDLHGGTTSDFDHFKELECDAICTKQPEAWANLLRK